MADLPEPLTWMVVNEIKAMISAIRLEAGYWTNLGRGPIHLDRKQRPETTEAYVSIFAGEVVPNGGGKNSVKSDMDITIEYVIPFVDSIASPELLAHRGRIDIVRALKAALRGRVEGFLDLELIGTGIGDAVVDGSSLVVAQVTARAGLSESFVPAN